MNEHEQLDPNVVVLDDLTRRVAMAQLEAAQWRARAIVAEQALDALRAEQETEEDGDE